MYKRQHLNISPETVDDPNRDRFVLSKGHAMEAYYAVLCHEGYLDLDDVKARFSKFGSPYIGHPNNKLKGIEMNSGSLGHGLPVAVGMALAGKMDGRDYRVYTIMGAVSYTHLVGVIPMTTYGMMDGVKALAQAKELMGL